jgi:hypothetical protein
MILPPLPPQIHKKHHLNLVFWTSVGPSGHIAARRLVSGRLGKLAPVGVAFAFQLREKALVTLFAF